jgi:type IV pilus assembly protein PilA
MNNVFTAKLLQNLNNKKGKKGSKGFTLIELLVVVIIIGVLAAVALPNLLAQVGKARETEGKNAIGTINRGQQAYHFEAGVFTPTINNGDLATVTNPLGVAIKSEYYTLSTGVTPTAATATGAATLAGNGTATSSLALASATGGTNNAKKNGIRGYSGAISFDSTSGLYGTVLCQGSGVATDPTPTVSAGGAGTCTSGTALK